MIGRIALLLSVAARVVCAAPCNLSPGGQWAEKVLEWSSEYGETEYGSKQVLGACDTPSYGDHPTAWAAKEPDLAWEYLAVSFPKPVHATGAVIRESFGNGFVFRVETIDELGGYTIVWEGKDPTKREEVSDLIVSWPITEELVRGLRISIDGTRFQGWEEVDSIQLLGVAKLPLLRFLNY